MATDPGWRGSGHGLRRVPLLVAVTVAAFGVGLLARGAEPLTDTIPVAPGDSSEATVAPSEIAPPDHPLVRGRWKPLPIAPLQQRFGHSMTWTGEVAVVFGGFFETTRRDGAAYDPDRRRWRRIQTSTVLAPRMHHAAVWDGDEVVVAGGWGGELGHQRLRDAAAYDPEANAWRRLPRVPFPVVAGGLFAHRGMLIALDTWGGLPTVATLTDGADRWERSRRMPGESASVAVNAAWSRTDLVVWWTQTATGFPVEPLAAAYDPRRRRWRTLDRLPGTPGRMAHGRLLAGSTPHAGAAAIAYEARSGTWSTVPIDGAGPVLAIGDGVVALGSLDAPSVRGTGSGRWSKLPDPPLERRHGTAAAWTGTEIVVWGGADFDNHPFTDGAAFSPEP